MKKASLALESRRQKEMNASISASFRHIKADYRWEKSLRYIVKFKEDIILIRDSDESDEPILSQEKDFEIEHDNSDGFGLMLPFTFNSYMI